MRLSLQSASMSGVSAHEHSLYCSTTVTLVSNTSDTTPDLLCSLAMLFRSYLSFPAPSSTPDASISHASSFHDVVCASPAGAPPGSPAGAPPASPAGAPSASPASAPSASSAGAPPASPAGASPPAANAAGSVPDSSGKAKKRRSNSHKRGNWPRKRRRRDAWVARAMATAAASASSAAAARAAPAAAAARAAPAAVKTPAEAV